MEGAATEGSTHDGGSNRDASADVEANGKGSVRNQRMESAVWEDIVSRQLRLDTDQHHHPLVQEREECKTLEDELLRKRKAIDQELGPVRKRLKEVSAEVEEMKIKRMQAKREALGISNQLWLQYQSFCDALQPKKSIAKGLLPFKGAYGDSYCKHDPDFSFFKTSVGEKSWRGNHNWRCHRVLAYSKAGTPIGYYVDYYTQTVFRTSKSWGSRFPGLYQHAWEAASAGSIGALEMLVALPERDSPCHSGWFFEFGFEEPRSSHPISSEPWVFRAAHDINDPASNQASRRAKLIHRLSLDIPKT